MLIDARALPHGHRLQADVCIVGGGAAGLTVATELARHGHRVVVLESGDRRVCHATQSLYEGAVSGHPYYALDACRFRVLGGSTTHWGGWCRPLDAIDFETREWIPHSGWPFTKAELDPYYARAHVICRLGPYEYDTERWSEDRPRLLPGDDDSFQDAVFQVQPTRFGPVYGLAAKASRSVDLVLNANVLEVVTDGSGRVAREVRAATLAGNTLSAGADVFVLAAGGIENARIMLASRDGRGVGNANGLVGRYFSDHLHVPIGLLRPKEGAAEFYRVHTRGGVLLRGGISLTEQRRRRERGLGFAVTLHNAEDPHDVLSIAQTPAGYASLQAVAGALRHGRWPERLRYHVAAMVRQAPEVCRLTYRKYIRRPPRTLLIGCRAEQAPNADNRVTLAAERDRLGMRKVRLQWKISEQDLASVRRAQELLATTLRRETVEMFPCGTRGRPGWADAIAGGAHHMGTTRMHRDPRQGVVEGHCRVHGTSNLYVAGSSVFPTGGWAPPTLTLVALALRLGDHLAGAAAPSPSEA